MAKSKWIFLKDFSTSSNRPQNQVGSFGVTLKTFKKGEVVDGLFFEAGSPTGIIGYSSYIKVNDVFNIPVSGVALGNSEPIVKRFTETTTQSETAIMDKEKKKSLMISFAKVVCGVLTIYGIYYFSKKN